MKVIKNRKLQFIAVVLVIALMALAFVFAKNTQTSEKSVKILDYGFSVCTQDVPSSYCGPYEVKVETNEGIKSTYTVPGFDNRQSEKYSEVSSKIEAVKRQGRYVILKVNDKREIISIN